MVQIGVNTDLPLSIHISSAVNTHRLLKTSSASIFNLVKFTSRYTHWSNLLGVRSDLSCLTYTCMHNKLPVIVISFYSFLSCQLITIDKKSKFIYKNGEVCFSFTKLHCLVNVDHKQGKYDPVCTSLFCAKALRGFICRKHKYI